VKEEEKEEGRCKVDEEENEDENKVGVRDGRKLHGLGGEEGG
jgi:hypothetical protein